MDSLDYIKYVVAEWQKVLETKVRTQNNWGEM